MLDFTNFGCANMIQINGTAKFNFNQQTFYHYYISYSRSKYALNMKDLIEPKTDIRINRVKF